MSDENQAPEQEAALPEDGLERLANVPQQLEQLYKRLNKQVANKTATGGSVELTKALANETLGLVRLLGRAFEADLAAHDYTRVATDQALDEVRDASLGDVLDSQLTPEDGALIGEALQMAIGVLNLQLQAMANTPSVEPAAMEDLKALIMKTASAYTRVTEITLSDEEDDDEDDEDDDDDTDEEGAAPALPPA